ncbi:MAG: hypothetical protein ACLFUT_06210 [Desulfobacteraceae bacterium]
MKNKTIRLLGLAFILSLLPEWTLAGPSKDEPVTWLILDLPPFFLTKGPASHPMRGAPDCGLLIGAQVK